MSSSVTKSVKLIHISLIAAIRSGDYYMFEELDDKLELDLFNKTQPDDFVEDSTENKYANKKKMSEVSF